MESNELSQIYKQNIPAKFFCYLLFYMKADMISIIISGIKYLSL